MPQGDSISLSTHTILPQNAQISRQFVPAGGRCRRWLIEHDDFNNTAQALGLARDRLCIACSKRFTMRRFPMNKVKNLMKERSAIHGLRDCKEHWRQAKEVGEHCTKASAVLTPKLDLGEIDKMLIREEVSEVPDARRVFGDQKIGHEKGLRDTDEVPKFFDQWVHYVWHKANKKIETCHFQVRRDLKRLMWFDHQNPKIKKTMGVWRMRRAKPGLVTPVLQGKKKGGSRAANRRLRIDALLCTVKT